MHVLITGGAGFIGSAVAVALLGRGDTVELLDCFDETLYPRAGKERNLAWLATHGAAKLHEGDVRDEALLGRLFAAGRFDAVIHLAALAGVRPSLEQAPRYFDVNVTGTARLLQQGRRAGLTRFVLASSSSVYGANTKVPFAEDDPLLGTVSPYAASKLSMEIAAATDHRLNGGDVSCLRFFTVYGPRQRPDMAIHKFLRLMKAGQPLPIFGDGSMARDYTFIDDIVQGVLGALDRSRGFRIYNLGGSRVVSLTELIAAIGVATGRTPVIERHPLQPGDVDKTHADLTRARAELGYRHRFTIEQGLAATWAWMQQDPLA